MCVSCFLSGTNCRDRVHGNNRLRITCDVPRSFSMDPRGVDLVLRCISGRVDPSFGLGDGCVQVDIFISSHNHLWRLYSHV